MRRLYQTKSKVIVFSLAILLIALSAVLCIFKVQATKTAKSNTNLNAIGEGVNIQTDIYKIEEGYISRILPETTLRDLKNNLDKEDITVTKKDGSLLKETEFVGTGMKLTYGQKQYKLAVVDDLNGDGKAGITDLTQMKLISVGLRAKPVNEYAKAADINGDGKVSITDLTKSNLASVNLIDIIAPVSFTPEVVSTKDTITVLGETADSNSGVKEYWFEINNDGWVSNTDKLNNKYTFTGLNTETKYLVRMKVIDNAGNVKITKRVEVETLNEENANINIVLSTEEWTNQSILVAINFNSNVAKEKKQVSLDNGRTWIDYTNPIKVEKNMKIKARVVNSKGEVLEEQEKTITNIDKLLPKEFTITTTTTSNSITINVQAEDADETTEYGKSGIKEYEYTLINGIWQNVYKSENTTHTINGLTPGIEYVIKVKAIDNAGNERMAKNSDGDEESGEKITTGTIDDLIELAGGITIRPSTKEWTNQNITVEVVYPLIIGLQKEISIDNGNTWKTYTGAQTIEGNTTVKARMKNSSGQASTPKSLEITNIDKLAPQEFSANIETTSNSITITASAFDADASNGSGVSGIAGYKFKINNEEWTELKATGEHTFIGLTGGQTYKIKVKAIDNAGNERMAKNSSGDEENGEDITIGTIDEIVNLAGGITINATPSTENWTNGDITVEVTYPDIVGLAKEISVDNGYNWKTYIGAETIEGNTTIKARMKDNTNQTSTAKTLLIDKIDKLAPKDFDATLETTADTITLTASTADAEATNRSGVSGIAGYKFKINEEEWTEVIENGEHTFTGLTEGQTYKIIVKAIDNAGNETIANNCKDGGMDVIPTLVPDYYGKEVTNYTTGGVNNWRIFHKDEEGRIYLIADDYISYDKIPTSTAGNALHKTNTDYTARFYNQGEHDPIDITQDYTGSEWIKNNTNVNAQKWLDRFLTAYPNSTNKNIKAVAYMMDTDSWSSFVGDKAEYAIGGPTIELFCASYKVTHPNRYIECDIVTENGYQLRWSDGSSDKDPLRGTIGFTENDDDIYIKKDTTKAFGMWLTSPTVESEDKLMEVGFNGTADSKGSIRDAAIYYCDLGFRPIVCIKTGYDIVKNEDGTDTYRIEDKGKPILTVEGNTDEWSRNKELTISATDAESGIASVTVNGMSQTLTDGACIYRAYSNGTYTIVATDNNGNATTEEIEITKIDNTAPTITFSVESNSTELATQELSVTVTEEQSGIAVCKYVWLESPTSPTEEEAYTDGRFLSGYTISRRALAGDYYLHVYMKDNAGNVSTTRTTGTFKFRYEISNQAELEQFSYEVIENSFEGKTVYLVDDINLIYENGEYWISIGNFYGNFEGNDHTINGLTYPLFTKNNGSIKNLGLTGVNINVGGNWNVAAVAIDNNGIIENCYVSGQITSTERAFVSGIACNNGSDGGYNPNAKIINCYVTSDSIISTNGGSASGIARINVGLIEKCYNAGTINETSEQQGFSASASGISDLNNGRIIECYNSGNINSLSNEAVGISGSYFTTSDNSSDTRLSYVLNCYNTGNITGHKASGIGLKLSKIENCYNSGTITSKSEYGVKAEDGTYHEKYASGIVSITDDGVINNTYNIGEIKGSPNIDGDNKYMYSVGGIAARATRGSVSNSYNSGVVSGVTYKGEIVGDYNSNCTISQCYYKSGNLNKGLGSGEDAVGVIEALDTMPTVLSVINGDDIFTVDSSINNGNPIFKWQVR